MKKTRPAKQQSENPLDEQGLPVNRDAERWILGGILEDPALDTHASKFRLAPDDFSLDRHRRIFRAMRTLTDCEEHINRVSVAEELMRVGELVADDIGYLADIENGMPRLTADSFASFVRIVLEKSARRRGICVAQKLKTELGTPMESLDAILASHTQEIHDLERVCWRGRKQEAISISEIKPLTAYGAGTLSFVHEPELIEGMVTALTGDSGSGKTTLALMHVRAAISDSRHVLVLVRENPLSVVLDQLKRLEIDPESPVLHYWGGWVGREAPGPASPEVVAWVERIIKETGLAPLVIVDSFSAFHGGDQNDAGETRAFMDTLRHLADLGAGVELIHHDGKAESARDYRGSSDFKASLDQAFHVTNYHPDKENRLHTLTLRCYKSRPGFSGTVVYSYANGKFVRDEKHGAVSRTVTEQLKGLLHENPGVPKREFEQLAKQAKIAGQRRAGEFLDLGVQAGEVHFEKNPHGSGGRYYLQEDAPPSLQSELQE
jgi:hypothetical protein